MTANSTRNMDEKILIAQVDILFSYSRNNAIAAILGSFILTYAQWSIIDHSTILFWLLSMFVAASCRIIGLHFYNKSSVSCDNINQWKHRYMLSSLPTHLSWATGAIVMFPNDSPTHQVATASVMLAVAAAGASSSAALRLPIFIFIPLVMIPLMISTARAPDLSTETLIPLYIIFMLFLFNIARKHYEKSLSSIILLLESKEREKRILKVEKKVRINEARLAEAERIGHMGSWEWDISSDKMYWSKETFQLLNIPTNSITPSFNTLIDTIHPEDRANIQKSISDVLKSSTPCSQICRFQLKDGQQKVIRSIAKPLLNDNNEVVRLSGIIQDITEQKSLEEQLLQSQKMESIGTLVGGIAHDFNNMLGSMLGQIYLAKKDVVNDDKMLKRLVNIERTSNRAATMVSQLLVFARKDSLTLKTINLSDFLKHAAALNVAGITENIEVQHRISKKTLLIKGDSTQLQQILLNLLNNASHAVQSQKKPLIIVSLEDFTATEAFLGEHSLTNIKHFAHLSVHDNGTGMREQDLQHIFEPFYTTKEQGQGTGLGLSMVYGAIQSHGGIISVESAVDSGTTVHIYLPLIEEAYDKNIQSISLQSLGSFKQNGATILLVDDEQILRESIQEALESLGYKVLTAENGKEAVEVFNQHQQDIQLLLTDVVMPKMSGHEAAVVMRESSPHLPIIFMSGYDANQISKAEIENSILLSKPVGIDVLDEHMQQLTQNETA